jgi:hypothetical protein
MLAITLFKNDSLQNKIEKALHVLNNTERLELSTKVGEFILDQAYFEDLKIDSKIEKFLDEAINIHEGQN